MQQVLPQYPAQKQSLSHTTSTCMLTDCAAHFQRIAAQLGQDTLIHSIQMRHAAENSLGNNPVTSTLLPSDHLTRQICSFELSLHKD